MVGAYLIPLMALVLATPPDAASLVARLASGTVAEREDAARGLEAMGRDSLPALAAALNSPDAEARSRILSVWERIQKGLMIRPALVRVDGQGRPLPEVVRSIGEQGGVALEISLHGRESFVNAREPMPIPFWQAIDRLGLVGDRVNNPGPTGSTFPTLNLAERVEVCPTSTSGPFRTKLRSLHDHRDRSLIDGPWLRVDEINQRIPIARGTKEREARFYADLETMVEPRMWLTQEGPARAIEAVDDLGQSLVRRDPARIKADHSLFFNGYGVAQAQVQLDLTMPEKPGRSIVRLRGTIPVALQVRRPIWALEIPLAGAVGKAFDHDDAAFTVLELEEDAQGCRIVLDIRLHLDRLEMPADPDDEVASSRFRCLVDHQLEIVDAEGNVMSSIGGGSWRGGSGRRNVMVSKGENKGRPARLRYYGMVRAFTDVAFEFQNIPLP